MSIHSSVRDLLADQRHREQRREVVGAERLLRLRAERGQRLDARLHDVGHEVEPRGGDLVGLQVESGAVLAHSGSPPRAAVESARAYPSPGRVATSTHPSTSRAWKTGQGVLRPGPRWARRSPRRTRCRGTGTRRWPPGRRTRPRRASSPGACTRRRTRTAGLRRGRPSRGPPSVSYARISPSGISPSAPTSTKSIRVSFLRRRSGRVTAR